MPADPEAASSRKGAPRFVFLSRDRLDGWWGNRHVLAARLSRTSPVVFLEPPARGRGSLLSGSSREVLPGLLAHTPREWPLQRFGPLRRLQVSRSAKGAAALLPPGPGILVAVLYARSSLEIAEALRPDLVVYHALDDYAERFDGTPDGPFLEWERRALRRADLVVAVSAPLAGRLRAGAAGPVEVLPSGYDEDLFGGPAPVPDPEVAALPRPVLGFAGTLREERLDLPGIRALAERFPGGTLAFLGGEAGPTAALRSLAPNVRLLGERPRERIPACIAAFDVAVAPYRDGAHARACSPIKVLEALAAGRPAVFAPARPDLADLAGTVGFASGPAALVAAVEAALAEGNGPDREAARREAVRGRSWGVLAARFGELASRAASRR